MWIFFDWYKTLTDADKKLLPESRAVLSALMALGHGVAVLTNSYESSENIRDRLQLPIPIFTAGDTGLLKPDIRAFRRAEISVGAAAADCVLVGDRLATDVIGALAAGWTPVWINPEPVDLGGPILRLINLRELLTA